MIPHASATECGRRPPPGQPVIALVMILAAWIAVRATIIGLEPQGRPAAAVLPRVVAQVPPQRTAPAHGAHPAVRKEAPAGPHDHSAGIATLAVPYLPRRSGSGQGRTGPRVLLADYLAPVESLLALPPDRWGGQAAAAHSPWAAYLQGAPHQPEEAGPAAFAPPRPAYRADPPPREAVAPLASESAQAQARPRQAEQPRWSNQTRWSADGWLFLRGGDLAPALASGAASYGGSQAGAVLRYALAPSGAWRPQAYLRASGAVGGRVRENEAAVGLAVRPLRALPLALMGEARLQDQGGPARPRPVVMAVTELPPLRMPFSAQAEAYGQAGWAGGRDATAFYDLAITVQRRVIAPLPGLQLNAGGGAWSGGQRGAARLDVGPRIELRSQLGPAARRIGVRVGVDWRFRVAGRAEPGSGPALTVAAGF
ncbi:hypothetical protein AQZ52_07765 [Novosphingobium fuchskuhlense]|uniref:Uncharacterized protein n=1 Tax=Novosphingobium fuchskuhlense TaxID=1117702 RepID=A0A124JW84_9SPHN|nr:hypothetical protein [Novosphingobium fuchskuhlense]KUR73072.1 hypothetical protein AQZ52_07765 [Novosphingobium fuchskuhlense]